MRRRLEPQLALDPPPVFTGQSSNFLTVRLSSCRKLGPNLPPAVLGKRRVRQILSYRAGRLSKGTVDQDIAPAEGVKVRLDPGGRGKFRRRLDLQAGLSVPEKNRRQKDMQPIKLAFFEKP